MLVAEEPWELERLRGAMQIREALVVRGRALGAIAALEKAERIESLSMEVGASPIDVALPNLVWLGSAMIAGRTAGLLALPRLQEVERTLELRGEHETLRLPRLRRVGGALLVNGATTTALRLAGLEEVGGTFAVRALRRARCIVLPSARSLGRLDVEDCPMLEVVALEALTTLGAPDRASRQRPLQILRNNRLHTLRMPRLSQITGTIIVTDNDALPSVWSLRALQRVAGARDPQVVPPGVRAAPASRP